MSFTNQTKAELVRSKLGRKCCQKAELAAFIHMRGHVILRRQGIGLIINAENTLVARRAFVLLKSAFNLHPELSFHKNTRLRKNNVFMVRIVDTYKVPQILTQLGLFKDNKLVIDHSLDGELVRRKCCRRSYLRGIFITNGYITNPESAYHLELVSHYETHSKKISELMKSFGLPARVCIRKQDYVVYLKNSDNIGEFLRVIGAGAALLEYENIRILKGMRNQINRLVNCETANVDKIVNAAQKQIQYINIIDKYIGIKKLPSNLRHIAKLRLHYPEASLRELGQMFNPPLGKSGVNHRLRRIEKIARQISSG